MVSSTLSAVIPAIVLVFCLPLFYLFSLHFHPSPITSIFVPDDTSLLHRAVAVDAGGFTPRSSRRHPPVVSRLSNSVNSPKIAFLFLSNSELYFAPLWEEFFQNANVEQYNIYIHLDPDVKIPPPKGVFEGKLIHSKKTYRSSPTLISAARRLLTTAIHDDSANTYFALISQYCIPLHSFPYLYSFLFDQKKLSRDSAFQSYIEILDKEPTLWSRYNARGEGVMIPEVHFHEFRGGSQFYMLTRKHALMVINDTKLWSKFKLPCLNVHTCYPEEHYFPTLLSMKDPDGCSHYTLTRVNWTNSVDGHPYTYQPSEVSPSLIYNLRKSSFTYSYMFARKFSPDCLGPLMEIAGSVIFKD